MQSWCAPLFWYSRHVDCLLACVAVCGPDFSSVLLSQSSVHFGAAIRLRLSISFWSLLSALHRQLNLIWPQPQATSLIKHTHTHLNIEWRFTHTLHTAHTGSTNTFIHTHNFLFWVLWIIHEEEMAEINTESIWHTRTHTQRRTHRDSRMHGCFQNTPKACAASPESHTQAHTHTKGTQANQQKHTPLTVSPQTHSPTHTHATPLTLTGCTFGGWMLQLTVSVSSLTVWEHRGRETLKGTSYVRERESVGRCGMQWKGVDEEKQSAARDKRKGGEGSVTWTHG